MHSVALIPIVSVHGSIVVRQFAIVIALIRTLAVAFAFLPHLNVSLDLPSKFFVTVFDIRLNSNFQLIDR